MAVRIGNLLAQASGLSSSLLDRQDYPARLIFVTGAMGASKQTENEDEVCWNTQV